MRCEFTCRGQKSSSSVSTRARQLSAQEVVGGTSHVHLHSDVKSLLILCELFCNILGVMHHEFFPQGQILNQRYYIDTLWLLEESVC